MQADILSDKRGKPTHEVKLTVKDPAKQKEMLEKGVTVGSLHFSAATTLVTTLALSAVTNTTLQVTLPESAHTRDDFAAAAGGIIWSKIVLPLQLASTAAGRTRLPTLHVRLSSQAKIKKKRGLSPTPQPHDDPGTR